MARRGGEVRGAEERRHSMPLCPCSHYNFVSTMLSPAGDEFNCDALFCGLGWSSFDSATWAITVTCIFERGRVGAAPVSDLPCSVEEP